MNNISITIMKLTKKHLKVSYLAMILMFMTTQLAAGQASADLRQFSIQTVLEEQPEQLQQAIEQGDGVLALQITPHAAGQFTAQSLSEWIKQGFLTVASQRVDLKTEALFTADADYVYIPFRKVGGQTGYVETEIALTLGEGGQSVQADVSLYTGRVHIVHVIHTLDEPFAEGESIGSVQLIVNTSRVDYTILDDAGNYVTDGFLPTNRAEFELEQGSYMLELTKQGYLPEQLLFEVSAEETRELLVTLGAFIEPLAMHGVLPMRESTPELKQRWTRSRTFWWIVAGAAVNSGAAIILTSDGGSTPWLPVPPGRP